MLHDAQRTSAPSDFSVSMSTAVWIVMWSEPVMRAPRSGCCDAYSSRIAMSAGISPSAIAISLRPQSASLRSATRKSSEPRAGLRLAFIYSQLLCWCAERRCTVTSLCRGNRAWQPGRARPAVAAPLGPCALGSGGARRLSLRFGGELRRFVRPLPGDLGLRAPEVAVGSGLLIDRPDEVQH